jgi:galactokinase
MPVVIPRCGVARARQPGVDSTHDLGRVLAGEQASLERSAPSGVYAHRPARGVAALGTTMTVDLEAFERHLAELETTALGSAPLFTAKRPPLLARAPGRLDVMGGIADYSGSLTLELPIAEAAFVAVQSTDSGQVRLVSAGFGPERAPLRDLALSVAELRRAGRSYADAHAYFHAEPARTGAAYVAGSLVALKLELGVDAVGTGRDILVASSVPEGKGVSSSAAVEVASFYALSALAGVEVDAIRVAILCQRIENLVVGAPCGVMDQMTSSCGSEGQLLPLLCQPAQLESRFPIPSDLAIWGIDSGLRHQVSGADYAQVRVAAFMGYTIIARALGLPIDPGPRPGKVLIQDAVYRGYLANVSVESFERQHAARLPERLSGEAFLREYAGIIDPITDVDPAASYRVRAATAHPIHEHVRAGKFRELMRSASSTSTGPRSELGARLGELMYRAHASYGACGLGSSGTDRLVELVRSAGLAQGLYGAKITGGGSGGTVAVLGSSSADAAVLAIADQYAQETGHRPHVFSGSSAGAGEFGVARLERKSGRWRVVR